MYKQGEIVLVPVPFTDLSSQKRRPVIIISNETYNQTATDIVVVAMTSRLLKNTFGFTITNEDMENGRLNRPSQVRVDKIYTRSQTIIVKKFGQVNGNVLTQIRKLLQNLTTS
jgi:mRNA interferase MazF